MLSAWKRKTRSSQRHLQGFAAIAQLLTLGKPTERRWHVVPRRAMARPPSHVRLRPLSCLVGNNSLESRPPAGSASRVFTFHVNHPSGWNTAFASLWASCSSPLSFTETEEEETVTASGLECWPGQACWAPAVLSRGQQASSQ